MTFRSHVLGFALAAAVVGCSRKAADVVVDTVAARADSVRSDSIAQTTPEQAAKPGPQPAKDSAIGDSAQADTVRGIVRRVGADPTSRLALATVGADGELLALSSAQLSELAAAEGLEIMASGARTKERAFDVAPGGAVVFHVDRFFVRAVDGVEARDGVLVEMNGHPFLEPVPGVHEPIVGLPTALKSQIGARIFLVGPRGSTPQAFGVLRKP